jgi:predicted phosphodiesterase
MKRTETAILTASDLHFGKKTSSYNPDVFQSRLKLVGERMESIRGHLCDYKFDKLVVLLLGDVNDGSEIYATQSHHQAITNVEEQASQLSDILDTWLRKLLPTWGSIEVEAIPGNHGRSGRAAHEAANWDIVTYRYLQKSLAHVIPVRFGGINSFIRKITLRKHKYLLYHGHDIRSFASIPWYGMNLRLSRWMMSHLAPFDVAVMGHFHTFGHWRINKLDLLCSGTMITDDEWALQCLGWESASKWWFFGASDERPITWQFGLDLQ